MPLGIQGKSLPRAFLPVPPPSLACPQVRPRLSGHARNMRILPALGLVMKAWSSAGSGDLISLPRGLLPRQWNFLLWLIVTSRACLFIYFFFFACRGRKKHISGFRGDPGMVTESGAGGKNTAGRGSSARSLHRPQTLSPYKSPNCAHHHTYKSCSWIGSPVLGLV